jgi:DNA polymerase I
MEPKRLVIIDGYSLLYRAFFATRYLSTADGRPTNALFGFVSMLFHLLENVKPDAIVVALDAPGKTFRHAEYAEYKGTRKETQPELKEQLPVARELIAALGIPSREVTGFEADDVVGTISRLGEANGYHSTIVTGDLDSLQLVDDCVSVLTMRQGVTDTVVYGPAQVEERYGFGPEFIPDYKALVGDTSDNIPGIPGIGAKGAATLIQQFGTVEGMLERIEEMEPKFRKKIEGLEEQLMQSKRLATIVCEAPIQYDFAPFRLSSDQYEAARAMLEAYEFRNHVRRMPKVLGPYLAGADEGGGPAPVEVESEVLEVQLERARTLPELREFVGDGRYSLYFAPVAAQGELFGEGERAAFVAVGTQVRQVSEEVGMELLSAVPDRAILHDAKPHFRKLSAGLAPPAFDTMLAAYVLQSGRSNYVLRDLVQGYLDLQVPTTAEGFAATLPILARALGERLEKEEQGRVLRETELPLVPILADMERIGIRADRDSLREFSKQLEVTIQQTTAAIFEMAGCEFTIGSPKQLGEVLFERLEIPGAQKTKTGFATGAEVLQQLAATYPICGEVLNWRELTKLKSTYADSLEKLIQEDGRIHTTYNQTVAATGRLSSNDPNLQNIPIRTELGRGIRKAFHAAEGFQLASLDYSQIELRVLAHMCGEPALVAAFQEGEDIHTATARRMFALGGGEATKEQRRLAKMLNYAVLYGVSEFGLAQQLGGGFSVAEARALIQQYNERFPSIKEFTQGVVEEARRKGFTTTLLGRRRYFPDIHAAKIMERKSSERQAMNAPIQGTAADMLKLAMVAVSALLSGRESRMLLNVHDELVIELADEEHDLIEPIRIAMEQALPLTVPVEVDAKVGADWNDMTPVTR